MNQSEVQEIITYHKKWLLGDKDGVRANFNKESDERRTTNGAEN